MTRRLLPPAELFASVERTPGTVLLEGAAPDPIRLFTAPLRTVAVHHLAELPALFDAIEQATATGQFAAGYFSYECGAFFEPTAVRLPRSSSQPDPQPLAWFGIYEDPCLFDPASGELHNAPASWPSHEVLSADRRLESDASAAWALSLTENAYARNIAAVHEWIRRGDLYQLNLTWPIQVQTSVPSAALYQHLRRRQPAPYGAFLHTEPSQRILSFSPELFFRVHAQGETRRISTRPMKGTIRRGRTTQEDQALAEWLENDPKNRSENVMIVDLIRNDLSRICNLHSVHVDQLFSLERFPTLWQMTSAVSGTLRPEVGFRDMFRALFPCGSITGAPKIRAMQSISELETQPRGAYTGAIGFFSKNDSVFNVAIRTLTLTGEPPSQTGVFGVGSGIVIDSNPEEEFRECLLKAQFLTASLAGSPPSSFSLVETLLWHEAYPLLALHLDRLEDSAAYFGFPCDRSATESALQAYASEFDDQAPRKVRLLLDEFGGLALSHQALEAPSAQPLRLCVSAERTDSLDPFYFHKTTHRPLYVRALQAATQAGFDDVLFLNPKGDVTEATLYNLFLEKDGHLFTPPVACGALAGVQRRHILTTNSLAQERVLTLEDLRQADALYLCNAVRGLRRAVLSADAPIIDVSQ